jgi:hypothetical protein
MTRSGIVPTWQRLFCLQRTGGRAPARCPSFCCDALHAIVRLHRVQHREPVLRGWVSCHDRMCVISRQREAAHVVAERRGGVLHYGVLGPTLDFNCVSFVQLVLSLSCEGEGFLVDMMSVAIPGASWKSPVIGITSTDLTTEKTEVSRAPAGHVVAAVDQRDDLVALRAVLVVLYANLVFDVGDRFRGSESIHCLLLDFKLCEGLRAENGGEVHWV